MIDRAAAGRKARMRGLSCERRCINYQREVLGRKVWRTRGSPTPDAVGWTEAGCWVCEEIKNHLLGPTALKRVAERLVELDSPPGTFLEVWMERPDGSWKCHWIDRIGEKYSFP